nr:tRNA-specific 2-thiouridylase MnmA [Tanacetum cinerariifolium]
FYEGQVCVGSGVILESWDDSGFPVCDKAREIANMEDKSKLGKPVKIKPRPEDCMRNMTVSVLLPEWIIFDSRES